MRVAAMDNAMDRHLDGDRICDLAEGTLDPALRAEAEAHVRGCPDCRRELEAARGYLREMSALTAMASVKAPPNFLANVRARLPQPSPLKRLLDGVLRPFRAIPMQVALLTVLGLTAISSYLYQRGGLDESPSMTVVSPTSAIPEPVAGRPEVAPRIAAQKRAVSRDEPDRESRVEGKETGLGKAEALAKNKSAKPASPPVTASLPIAAPTRAPVASEGSAAPRPPAKTMARDAAGNDARSVAGSAKKRSAKAEEMDPLGGAPVSEYMSLRVPAPQPSATATAPEPAPADDKAVYEELESISMKDDAAISASGEVSPAAPADKAMDKDERARSEPKATTPAAKDRPGFTLRLDRGKQSADVLAGLKAMGAELESGPERAEKGGPRGDGYVLLVPAAMVKDLPAYLARYGRAVRAGDLPAGESRVRILLFFVPAPK
jgi:hypothetical protein